MSLEPATSDKSLDGEQQHKLGEQQLQEEVEEQPKRVPPVEVGKRGWLNKRLDGIPFVSVSGKFISPPPAHHPIAFFFFFVYCFAFFVWFDSTLTRRAEKRTLGENRGRNSEKRRKSSGLTGGWGGMGLSLALTRDHGSSDIWSH